MEERAGERRCVFIPLSSVLSPLVRRGERMESLMQPRRMEGTLRARAASSSWNSPSPPSDGGEGWGEEVRFYSPLLGPLPTRSSRGEDGELDAAQENGRDTESQGCIKLLEFSLSSIRWRRGQGRGGAFLFPSPRSSPHSFVAGRGWRA